MCSATVPLDQRGCGATHQTLAHHTFKLERRATENVRLGVYFG